MKIMLSVTLLLVLISLATVQGASECGENESVSPCGRMCEPTCDNRDISPATCPGLQCTKATEACRCDDGYYRCDSGRCLAPDDCPNEG